MRIAVFPVVALTALTSLSLLAAPSLRAQGSGAATAAAGATGAAAAKPAPLCSSPAHESAAHELIVQSGAEQQVKQSADAMIDAQLRAAPQMAEFFGDLIRGYVTEQMQWSALEPGFTRLYCDTFTEPELRQMIAFNRTPLGQKILTSMPVLMQRAMKLGEERINADMPAFQKRMEERMAKLRADGKIPD